jgi:hypothetical protein
VISNIPIYALSIFVTETLYLTLEFSLCNLNPRKMSGEVNSFTVEIKYTDGVNSYSENCPINFEAYTQNIQARASTKDKELKIISYTLQDLVEKQF